MEFQRMRVAKFGIGAQELKFTADELFLAILRKIANHRVFAFHDGLEVKAGPGDAQSPGRASASQVEDVCRIEERFAGHATAQNAKSAQLLRPFDENGAQASSGGGAGRRVNTTASAYDGNFKIELVMLTIHRSKMRPTRTRCKPHLGGCLRKSHFRSDVRQGG